MHHAMASPTMTAAAHAAGKVVHVWTTNTPPMIRHALTAAVDALVTIPPRRRKLLKLPGNCVNI